MPNTNATFEPGSTITLCRVLFDSGYKNVVDWPSKSNKESYFSSLSSTSVTLQDSTYMPVGSPIVVDIPYSVAYQYNYCYVTNPPQLSSEPDAKTYYYFIVGMRYNNPATVTLTLQLDVWTTYRQDFVLSYGFLEQGHLAQANSYALADTNVPATLRRYLAVNEGIDVGTEMLTVHEEHFSLQLRDNESAAAPDAIVIVSTADLTVPFGTVADPKLETAQGGASGGLINGCDVYVIERSSLGLFLNAIKPYSWVAQCIISITTIPARVYDLLNLSACNINGSSPSWGFYKMGSNTNILVSFADAVDMGDVSGSSFYGYDVSDLRKLWTYPYSVVELTTWDGTSVFMKPQNLRQNVSTLNAMFCAVPPYQRVGWYVQGYGYGGGDSAFTVKCANGVSSYSATYPVGDFLDSAAWISGFPQFSIVNNSYIAYMASTAHTREYSYSSAGWSLASANRSNQVAYENSLSSIAAVDANNRLQAQFDAEERQGSYRDAAVEIGMNAVSGLLNGPAGIAGAIGSTVSGIFALKDQVEADNARAALNASLLATTRNAQTESANRNMALASYVTEGDYRNQIASIEAGVADAALRPPSQVGQSGGDGFRYAVGLLFGCTLRIKRASADAICRVSQYFRRFGYSVHRYVQIPARLNVCEYFSYYKMTDVGISSAYMDETEKNAVRGIFAAGVTLWEDAREIGTVDPMLNKVRQNRIDAYYQ